MLRIFVFILLGFICSCSDPYLYDKIGFGPGDRPKNYWNPDYPARRVVPNHGQQASPNMVSPQGAGSRFYSNPYANAPSTNQYQRYDADQYYYPPNYQYDLEQMQLYQLHKELLPES